MREVDCFIVVVVIPAASCRGSCGSITAATNFLIVYDCVQIEFNG